jgi:SAM-dependent methyltransferase
VCPVSYGLDDHCQVYRIEEIIMTKNEDLSAQQDVTPKARGGIHKTILSWFSQRSPGLVLDAPAGFGHLSMHLKRMGHTVVCGEIDPGIFKIDGLQCIYTDLNDKIDSPHDTFDYVCCVDGLEHMTNPYRAVQELARVLKPGGYGVFSFPNYSNIEKRAKFFFSGYLTKPKSREDYERCQCNLYNFHNTPLTITLANLMFEINDLDIENIMRDTVKWKQFFWLPFVLLLKLHAHFQSDAKWKKYRYDLTLKNEVILGGNTLICITRKRDS